MTIDEFSGYLSGLPEQISHIAPDIVAEKAAFL
jgi:hypothetical protein